MRYDATTLADVERGASCPTLRFFRFREPTMSYGRLQPFEDARRLVPLGWSSVQRPTGGGVVLHDQDLCFSLTWPKHQSPLPERPQDQYRWIHTVVLEALSAGGSSLRMACCQDVSPAKEPFAMRSCFTNPVGYDLLQDNKKLVGGALRVTRKAVLYQGSIQMKVSPALEEMICNFFRQKLG